MLASLRPKFQSAGVRHTPSKQRAGPQAEIMSSQIRQQIPLMRPNGTRTVPDFCHVRLLIYIINHRNSLWFFSIPSFVFVCMTLLIYFSIVSIFPSLRKGCCAIYLFIFKCASLPTRVLFLNLLWIKKNACIKKTGLKTHIQVSYSFIVPN